jgi:hypothetical protein
MANPAIQPVVPGTTHNTGCALRRAPKFPHASACVWPRFKLPTGTGAQLSPHARSGKGIPSTPEPAPIRPGCLGFLGPASLPGCLLPTQEPTWQPRPGHRAPLIQPREIFGPHSVGALLPFALSSVSRRWRSWRSPRPHFYTSSFFHAIHPWRWWFLVAHGALVASQAPRIISRGGFNGGGPKTGNSFVLVAWKHQCRKLSYACANGMGPDVYEARLDPFHDSSFVPVPTVCVFLLASLPCTPSKHRS